MELAARKVEAYDSSGRAAAASDVLGTFRPLIRDWFAQRFGAPTEPQIAGWPLIRDGRDVLISAPTGSGKTLAAFLIALDGLAGSGEALPDETLVIYVSPLKALANDVRKNLETPLAELRECAAARGTVFPAIRTATRTGDTTTSERAKMLRRAPHILVTTPESLFILVTSERARALFRSVRTVIVDEIHAIADDKRGSHLALTLARLDEWVMRHGNRRPQKIGLSATVQPIATVARFLSDDAQIVDVGHRRAMELAVEVPRDELGPVASHEMWSEIYDRVAELTKSRRTTLIFVSTRRLAERAAYALAERLGPDAVLPHHGSMSREARFAAETKLKNGELRAVVATASLELGIDIGSIDLVVQLGSPRSIAVALQRIGRSGHWVGARPHGRLFATTRDELVECAALVHAIREGRIDALTIPHAPLDILAQQIVAACSSDDWSEEALFQLVRSTYPYRDLDRATFDDVVAMLSDGIATSRGRSGAFLHHDRVNAQLRARRGARLAAVTSGGAIPDRADYTVIAEPDGATVGTLDEDFAIESLAGDVFMLGTASWKIRRVERGVVRVENAHGAPPTVPFWNGEGLGRTLELSNEVAQLREAVDERTAPDAVAWLERECGVDRLGAEQIVAYVGAAKRALGTLPTVRTIVAERFFDESGGMQLIIHAPFGARINRAWGLALRKRFCRSFNFELQAAATDNGIVLSLSDQHAFPLEGIFAYLNTATVTDVLTQALLDAPVFTARWRWNATRALAILRFRGGHKVAPALLRMRSDDLLAAVFPDQAACAENLTGPIRIPDHVLVRTTIDDCLHEAMDLGGLLAVLGGIERGEIRTAAIDTPEASPFAHEILNANPYAFLDDAPLEERRARAVQLRRTLRTETIDGNAVLDPLAIAGVAAESFPLVRDAEELHDALCTLIVVPPDVAWTTWFEDLRAQRRATVLHVGDGTFWTCAERLNLACAAYPHGTLAPSIDGVPSPGGSYSHEDALLEVVRGWMESSGPATMAEIATRLALTSDDAFATLVRLEHEGQVLRGRFRSVHDEEWCNRRVLARIHRRTIGVLRREIEPVSTADFMRFVTRWQHVLPSARLHGIDGTLHVIRQLEGYEIPAVAWEAQIFPSRVANYRPEFLDALCTSGEVMWGRLSAHPAFAQTALPIPKRIRPTRIAPVAIFLREHAGELTAPDNVGVDALSHAAQDVLAAIARRGAPFFGEIVSLAHRLPAEVEEALWELVAAGFVTADAFDALRSLIDVKRRLGTGRSRPRASSGRWTQLRGTDADAAPGAESFARRMLARWGVVFRDLAAREALAPPWRDVLIALRRLEARGEIRGGRFLASVLGEQFALPEALETLRAVRRSEPANECVDLPGTDPLHLAGILLPGARSDGPLRLRDGVPAGSAHEPIPEVRFAASRA